MKKLPIIFILVLAAATACAENPESGSTAEQYTTYEGVAELLEERTQGEDFFLIDVRTPAEYEGGHIPQAYLIPVDTIGDNPPETSKDTPIIVYCRTGNRSGAAKRILENQGFSNVYNFGGYRNWKGEFNTGSEP